MITGKKTNKTKVPIVPKCNLVNTNFYETLPSNTTTDPPTHEEAFTIVSKSTKRRKRNTPSSRHVRHTLRLLAQQESAFLERSIVRAENEKTHMAKHDINSPVRIGVDKNHMVTTHQMSWKQLGKDLGARLSNNITKTAKNIIKGGKKVTFATKRTVREYQKEEVAAMITYDSGADGNYISEKDRIAANLPILHPYTKRVAVANGGTSTAKHETALPFAGLSAKANKADTFNDFPTSLMSVGRTADDGTISIFTKDGVTVHKEEDVLITCRGEPILIGVRDEHGRYRVPLMQQKGQWQPRAPKKRVVAALQQANNVYDLPSIEQAIGLEYLSPVMCLLFSSGTLSTCVVCVRRISTEY